GGSARHGHGARPLLPGMLCPPDGPAVRRRRDESVVGRRTCRRSAGRKARAVRGVDGAHSRLGAGDVRRMAVGGCLGLLTIRPFPTLVPLYERFRPPYPPAFFHTVSMRLGLGGRHRLIDLGTGPGLLALGFAPYVGRIVGVDPEPAMLAAAREAAGRAAQDLTL